MTGLFRIRAVAERHGRVSLGTPEQMERWAETLRSFRERGWV